MLILNSGWVYKIEIIDYTRERPMPIAQTPDSPGFDDEGDAEEVDYRLVSINPEEPGIEGGEFLPTLYLEDLILEQCRLDVEERI